MSTQALTLGQALAVWEAERRRGNPDVEPQLSLQEREQLQSLRQRMSRLAEIGPWQEIFKTVPERCCRMEEIFLAGNEAFFVACLLVVTSEKENNHDCMRFFKHLNDCYTCFDEFCHVIRDYYHKSQELLSNANDSRLN